MEGYPELSPREEATLAVGDFLKHADWEQDPLQEIFEHRYRSQLTSEGDFLQASELREADSNIVILCIVRLVSSDPRDRNCRGYIHTWSPRDSDEMSNNEALEKVLGLLGDSANEAG